MHHITADAFQEMEKGFRTNLINCLSGIKSAHLVGTINSQRLTNLAVFSQVFHVGADPALIGMLVRPHTVRRHTLENILEVGDYTLNHIRKDFLMQAHHTSARWDISEFSACRLTPCFTNHKAPYVAEANIRIGLSLIEKTTIKSNGTVLLIGEIKEVLLPDFILHADGFIDLEKAGTLAVSGLDSYHSTEHIARLSYAKTDHLPQVKKYNLEAQK